MRPGFVFLVFLFALFEFSNGRREQDVDSVTAVNGVRSINEHDDNIRRRKLGAHTVGMPPEMLETVDQAMISGSCFRPHKEQTLQVAARSKSSGIPPPKPILNMGMPKCGSTSLFTFLYCAEYAVSHFFCVDKWSCASCMYANSRSGNPPLQNCGNWDAYTQLDSEGLHSCFFPQAELLEEIHDESPDATFVLTFRNVDHWIASVKKWKQASDHPPMNELLDMCYVPGKPVGKGSEDEELRHFFCSQVQRVRDFVDSHPTHTLIEIDIEDPNTAQIMADIFQVSDKCWTKSNGSGGVKNSPPPPPAS
jgi:hypothetical protein